MIPVTEIKPRAFHKPTYRRAYIIISALGSIKTPQFHTYDKCHLIRHYRVEKLVKREIPLELKQSITK